MRELLRRAGFDVEAKIAAVKLEVEGKAQHLLQTAKDEVRVVAVSSALWLGVGLMGFLMLLVALAALYLAVEPAQGPFVALAAVALVLCILATGFAMAAFAVVRRHRAPTHLLFPPRPLAVPTVEIREAPSRRGEPGMGASPFGALRDVFVPLLALIGRYRPLTGHWGVDGVIRHVGSRTQDTAQEAVLRAADLVQTGSRGTMVGVLAVAAVIGWLAVRRRS